jgi:hypothetical protein
MEARLYVEPMNDERRLRTGPEDEGERAAPGALAGRGALAG